MHILVLVLTASYILYLVLRDFRSGTITKLSRSAHLRLHIEIETLCLSEVNENGLATRSSDRALDSRWTTVLVSLELVMSGI